MTRLRHLASIVLLAGSAPLAAEIQVGGKVITADGEPVAKARVTLEPLPSDYELARRRLSATSPEPAEVAASDGEGLFAVVAADAGFWTLRVEKPGFVPRELDLTPLLDAADLVPLELESGREITVRVLDPDGEPVAGRVRAARELPSDGPNPFRRPRASGPWSTADFLGVTGPDTEVRWTIGTESDWLVEAHVHGYPPLRRQVEPASRQVELRLKPGVERRVEVVDSRGRPVAGAAITLEGGLLPLTETDGKGQATLIVDGAGDVALDVLGPAGHHGAHVLPPIESAGEPGPRAEIIELEEPITVSGRVIDEETRQPIAAALVWARSAAAGRSDSGGGYVLTGPQETLRAISAAAADYSTGFGMVGDFRGTGLPPGETAADGPTISLTPAASLQGVVVDQNGQPLRSVEIECEPKLNRGRRRISFRPRTISSQSGRTADQGRFRITGLPLDSGYLLRFAKDGFASAKLEIDDLASHKDRASLRIVMLSGRRGAGWVVDEQDAPVAGAEVRLTEAAAAATGMRRRFEAAAGRNRADSVTGSEGRFEIAGVAPGRYNLEAEAPGFATATVLGIEIPGGEGEIDLGTLVLIPGATIEGRVVDDRGLPIAEAGIRVSQPRGMPDSLIRRLAADDPPEALAGADGRFLVRDQQPGGRVDLSVHKEGFVVADVAGVEAPTREPLEIVLRAASKVLGRVIDADARPVAAARVEVLPERQGGSGVGRGMRGRRGTTADKDGTFEISDVEPGRVTIEVSAAGFRRQQLAGLEVPADAPLRGLVLVLMPGAEVRGTVTEADGSPVAGIFVAVTDPGSTGLGPDGTLTDADGKFLVSGAAAGLRKVLAMDRASRRTSKNVEIELGTNIVDLVFAGGVEVSGQVLDDAGAVVAGARVFLRESRIPGVPRIGLEAASGADGSFTVSDVQPGSYEVSALREGYAPAELGEPVEIGTHPVAGLVLRLGTGAVLSGRVLGLEYGDLVRVEIRAMVSGGATVKPDFEGRYRIPNLPAGELTVQADIPGSGRQVRARTTIPEGAPEAVLDLEFGSGFTLTGIVLHGERPLSGAVLWLGGINVAHASDTTVSQDGTFRVEGLVEGSYRLSVADWESGLQHGEEVEITADADVRIEISTARIAGQVRDAIDFTPIEAASVTAGLIDRRGSAMRGSPRGNVARSDARGYFSLGEVAEGTWKVSAVKSGYGPAEQTVVVRSGNPVEDLDLAMSATEGLSFEIVMAAGRTPRAVHAAFLDGAGNQVADGTFETSDGEVWITTLPAGSWEMLLAAEDGALMSLPVTVPGKLGQVVVPPGGRLLITVPELEAGAVSASIRLTGPDGRPYRYFDYRAGVRSELRLRGGSARAANLAGGIWTVHAMASDGRSWSTSATVVPGAETEVSVP